VFLSHLTNRNIDSKEDSFFGKLPDEVTISNQKVGIIYSNQTRNIRRSIIERQEQPNNIVITKYLNTKQLIQFYLRAFKSMKYTLRKMEEFEDSEKYIKWLISKACISFLTIESMKTFHLIEETKNLISIYKPKNIFLTAEGHIYENTIYLYCLNRKGIEKVFMVQNSPIVSCQFGLFDFIKRNQNKLIYLVQGKGYKNLFTKLNPSANVIIIGKDGLNFKKRISDKSTQKLLIVPDGDKRNIRYFLNHVNYLFKNTCPNIFISLHPDTPIGVVNYLKLRYLMKKRLITESYSNLKDNDLDQFSIVAYTSSSLAIKSFLSGTDLIYLSDTRYNLDPLWIFADNVNSDELSPRNELASHVYSEDKAEILYSQLNFEVLFCQIRSE
jgi:hypothetical protein